MESHINAMLQDPALKAASQSLWCDLQDLVSLAFVRYCFDKVKYVIAEPQRSCAFLCFAAITEFVAILGHYDSPSDV